MNAHASGFGSVSSRVFDYTPLANSSKGLREWWLTPPRRGIHRIIAPWEYRHLYFFGRARLGSGIAVAALGGICLSYDAPGWAAMFVAIGALSLLVGSWFLGIARSAADRN